jgi:hypothetical protein
VTRTAIDTLLYAMDRALDGGRGSPFAWHTLAGNLAAIDRKDWSWRPPDGGRTVWDLVEHIGGPPYVYESQAFGDRSIHWPTIGLVYTIRPDSSADEMLAWVRGGYGRLRARLEAMEDDTELLVRRMSPQGVEQEARWVFTTMIEHCLYHTGEINHLRALRQGNDC